MEIFCCHCACSEEVSLVGISTSILHSKNRSKFTRMEKSLSDAASIEFHVLARRKSIATNQKKHRNDSAKIKSNVFLFDVKQCSHRLQRWLFSYKDGFRWAANPNELEMAHSLFMLWKYMANSEHCVSCSVVGVRFWLKSNGQARKKTSNRIEKPKETTYFDYEVNWFRVMSHVAHKIKPCNSKSMMALVYVTNCHRLWTWPDCFG